MFEKYYGSSLYLKAPNGKDTRLDEPLWIAVRTPTFKKWFGDWEKLAWAQAAMDFLEKTAPVKELSGREFQKDGVKLTEKVPAFFKSINNVAHNNELGDVVLDSDGVKDSISHGVGKLKAAAFMSVPEVIEKGFVYNRETNWKNRNYDTAVIVAPIRIGKDDYICEVVVKKDAKRTAFYLHEVEIKKTLEDMFKTTTEGAISQASKLILGKHLQEVKGNVSQVVDENGEPLVVYHGTNSVNDDYTHFTVFGHPDPRVKKHRHFFSANRDVAGSMGSYVYEVFLECKNPLVIDAGGNEWGMVKDHTGGRVKFADLTNAQKKKLCKAFDFTAEELESSYAPEEEIDLVQAGVIKREERNTNEWAEYARANGHDGIIFRNVRDGADYSVMQKPSEVFVVFDSTQIKSAYGNAKFNPNDADIYREPSAGGANVAADASNAANGEGGQISRGDSRYVAERFDATPRAEGWSKEEADKAFDDLWNALGGDGRLTAAEMRKLEGKIDAFTKKIDPRMIELPEVLDSSVVPLAQDFVKAEGGGNVHVHAVGYSVRVHGNYHFLEETRFPVGGKSGFFAAHYNGAGGF